MHTVEILKIAFNEFIQASAGAAATTLTDATLEKANKLQKKIITWFSDKNHAKADKAIAKLQSQGSLEALSELTTYLDNEISEEPDFAKDLLEIAQEIVEMETPTVSKNYISNGRDQIIINRLEGGQINIGGGS